MLNLMTLGARQVGKTTLVEMFAAGSLLETLIDSTISFPVGRVDFMPVCPCSFDEYLMAAGENKSLELLKNGAVPEYGHDKLTELFRNYTVIGGMPEVLNEYAESRHMNRLGKIYDRLIVSYQDEVEKYAHNETLTKIVRHIIDSAFHFADSRITFANFGKSNYRSREMGEAFRILEKTMLLQLVFPVTQTKLPLEEKLGFSPKLLMLDTGLVNYSAGLQKQMVISKRIDELYNGSIAEHIAGQELQSRTPSVRSKLNFWVQKKSNSQAELDYVLPWNDMLIPIEFKSGASGTLRSLHKFKDEEPHDIVIIYSGGYKVEYQSTLIGKKFRLVNLPFYLIGQINMVLDNLQD